MFITSLLLSATVAVVAPTQSAYTSTDPIQIASCSVAETPAVVLPWGGQATSGSPEAQISFVNTDSRPVSSVVFAVSDGRGTSQIVDKGTFSNGIEINHRFLTPEFAYALGDLTCKVQSVAFADGSTWQAQ
ncbi:MAG TPA: hypothetical protein VMB20_14560 [Candidatus Acidoferrum sp.]|nr:hypothetical protein [Candidatus Acidoferrum sp.]